MFFVYRILTNLIVIFFPIIILFKKLKKKEHPARFKEKIHTKKESSKTKVAREGLIKIETIVLTPKSSRSRISSKSCSHHTNGYF